MLTPTEAFALGQRAAVAAEALHKAGRIRDPWLSGMLIRYGDRDEPHDVRRIGGEDGREHSRPIAGSRWWPDGRDAATRGCWLELAREACREPHLSTFWWDEDGDEPESWAASVCHGSLHQDFGEGDTEAEALVSALESASC